MKVFLMAASVMICCLTAGAQGFGVRAGVLISQQDYEESGINFDSESRVGLDLAILYEAVLGGNLAIQPELHFIQKGSSIQDAGTNLDVRVDYLEAAILLKLAIIGNSGGLSISPFLGPSAGYAMSGDQNGIDFDFDGDDIKRLDFGAHVGASFKLPLGALGLFADIRYYFGIADISDISTRNITNQGVGIGAGIIF